MSKKIWYEIYGVNKHYPDEEKTLLAKVKSKGLAYIVAQKLTDLYIVEIR